MSIEYIFNGYFRSGTSILWKILKDSNKKYKVFYEPLNPYLFEKINEFSTQNHPIHKMLLFLEYTKLDIEDFEKFKLAKENFPYVLPRKKEEINRVLGVFESLDEPVILQTNRLHFYNNVLNLENIEFYHIIRNPNDVYLSMLKYGTNNKFQYLIKKIKKILKKMYKVNQDLEMFQLNDFYELLIYMSNSKHKKYLINQKNNLKKNPWLFFLAIYILTNYYAIRNIQGENIILYEDLITKPDSIKRRIEKKGINFNIGEIKYKNINKVDKYFNKKLIKDIKTIGLMEEYKQLTSKILM